MNYIDPRAKALRHLDRLAGWQAGQTPAPVTVEWDLSNRCYLGCQDCHFAHTHVKGPWASKTRTLPMAYDGTGDLADFDLVARALGDMAAAGVQGLVWSGGGEPTTHPRWVDVLARAADCGLRSGMYTAGGLLTRESAIDLAHLAEWVVVSLDTIDGQTYLHEKGVAPTRFDGACQGVRWLAATGQTVVGVSFLLHAENFHQAAAMLALARRLGATYATFRPAIQTSVAVPAVCTADREWVSVAEPILTHLARQPDVELDVPRFLAYRDWTSHGYETCHGIRLNTTITPDGRVWICPQRRGIAGSCLGDLRTESFEALWARHPGHYTVDAGCRVMCRLHPVNETLAALATPRMHEAFV